MPRIRATRFMPSANVASAIHAKKAITSPRPLPCLGISKSRAWKIRAIRRTGIIVADVAKNVSDGTTCVAVVHRSSEADIRGTMAIAEDVSLGVAVLGRVVAFHFLLIGARFAQKNGRDGGTFGTLRKECQAKPLTLLLQRPRPSGAP